MSVYFILENLIAGNKLIVFVTSRLILNLAYTRPMLVEHYGEDRSVCAYVGLIRCRTTFNHSTSSMFSLLSKYLEFEFLLLRLTITLNFDCENSSKVVYSFGFFKCLL